MGAVAKLADAVVLRLPRARARPRELVHLLPSWRVLAIAFGALLAVGAGYASARQSALFAVQTVEIRGAPPAVSLAVRPGAPAPRGREPPAGRSRCGREPLRRDSVGAQRELRPSVSEHAPGNGRRRAARGRPAPRAGGLARVRARPGDPAPAPAEAVAAPQDLGADDRRGGCRRRARRRADAPRRPRSRSRFRRRDVARARPPRAGPPTAGSRSSWPPERSSSSATRTTWRSSSRSPGAC